MDLLSHLFISGHRPVFVSVYNLCHLVVFGHLGSPEHREEGEDDSDYEATGDVEEDGGETSHCPADEVILVTGEQSLKQVNKQLHIKKKNFFI